MKSRRVSWVVGTLVLSVLILSGGAEAAARDAHETVLDAVATGDIAAAVRDLERIEFEDRARFHANNYDYLLARLLEHRGDFAGAAARYSALVDRGSNLAAYGLWRLAGISRLEGNFPAEREYLERLTTRYRSSLLYRRAVERLARNAFDGGDYATVVARLSPVAGVRGDAARDALARLGVARMRLGDTAGARRDFDRLMDGSQDDYALAAAQGLDELDRMTGRDPSEADHMRRGNVYINNRVWLAAQPHFMAVADTAGSQNRSDALYALGLVAYRLERLDEAVDWWVKVTNESPSSSIGIRAHLWTGHALQRAGRYTEAVAQYAEFIDRYPRDDQVESAYRNAIDSLRYAQDAESALEWCNRAEAAQPRSTLATFAAFNRAKVHIGTGNYTGALGELARLKQGYNLRSRGPGLPSAGEIDLLRGVCLERLGRFSEAISLYLSKTPGRDDYFGNRATLRLIALGKRQGTEAEIRRLLMASLGAARTARRQGNASAAKAAADRALRFTDDPAIRDEMLEILEFAYAKLPAYSRVSTQATVPVARAQIGAGQSGVGSTSHEALGAELAFLGLFDEAAPELEAAGLRVRSPYSMEVYNVRGSRADGAVQLGISLTRRLPDDYRVELMPREAAELLYPAPYRDVLRKFAIPSGVDPRFELSIARQESVFKPWVKSPAAARGLMQFIAETSNRMAKALGVDHFDQDDLYEPEVALRFGARYLADLFAQFPDNPYAVAASYNGGEDNVARWIGRAADPTDVELIVAEISYRETKDYVYKVMNNYWAYQAIYTRELNPR